MRPDPGATTSVGRLVSRRLPRVPLAAFLAVVVTLPIALIGAALAWDHATAGRRLVAGETLRQARILVESIATASERLLDSGSVDAVQDLLDAAGRDRSMEHLALIDGGGRIVASNQHEWVGRDESAIDDKDFRRLAYTARTTRRPQENGADARRSILVTPLLLRGSSTGPQDGGRGLLYVRLDRAPLLEALSVSAVKQGTILLLALVASGLCAWLGARAFMVRPAREMAAYLRAARQGGVVPPLRARGPREVVRLMEDLGRAGAEMLRLKSALQDSQQQHQETQRMESVASLAGAMAHELNNLLTGILGYARLLLDRVGQGDPIRRQLAVIENSASRAAGLTGRLLTFSRRVASRPAPTDLGALLAPAIESVRAQVAAGTDLEVQRQDDLWDAVVDGPQIRRVFLALCANAREAMPCGGRLTVALENRTLTAEDCRGRLEAKEGRYVAVSVADTGAGVDPDLRRRLFEPSPGSDSAVAPDLGLAIVYGLVKGNDGWMEVRSDAGYGTRFTVFLPACETATATVAALVSGAVASHGQVLPSSAPASHPSEQEVRPATILAVDDESAVLALSKDVLEMHGYKVLTARNGEEALRVFRAHQAEIVLVLLDLTMPVMGGRECFRELKRIDPAVRVVISSGFSSESSASEMLNDGALDYLQKPYDIDVLARAVTAALDRRPAQAAGGARS